MKFCSMAHTVLDLGFEVVDGGDADFDFDFGEDEDLFQVARMELSSRSSST